MIPEHLKAGLIEKYRHAEIDHEWWSCVYEDTSWALAKVGFEVKDMRFSGFCCQGDGASITGHVGDLPLLLTTLGLADAFPMSVHAWTPKCAYPGAYMVRRDKYCNSVHENTLSIDVISPAWSVDLWEDYSDGISPLEVLMRGAWNEGLIKESLDLETVILDAVKDFSRKLYFTLEDEYDHLRSDETVLEYIEANWESIRDDLDPEDLEELGEV